MSAPVKRTVFALSAAILMAALSAIFAITLARLTRQQQPVSDGEPVDDGDSAN